MLRMLLIIVSCIFIDYITIEVFADENCFGPDCSEKPKIEDCPGNGRVSCTDWRSGVVYAIGFGAPNAELPTRPQQIASAIAAAKLSARFELSHMIEKLRISQTQTMAKHVMSSSQGNALIQGVLQRSQQHGQHWFDSNGLAWVSMKAYINDVIAVLEEMNIMPFGKDEPRSQDGSISSIYSGMKPYGESSKTQNPNQVYTGLILDTRGLGITPILSPKILDESGNEVYGSMQVQRKWGISEGIVGYEKDLEKAKKNIRVKGNPLIMKAIRIHNDINPVIKQNNADSLRKMDSTLAFLREARVVFLVD